MTFWWWDDAVLWANLLAADTMLRHYVRREPDGLWEIGPVAA